MPGADLIDAIVALWRALEIGDAARVARIHAPLAQLIALQKGLDGFLAVEKHLLRRRGIFRNTLVRGPVGFVLDENMRREVDQLFDDLQAELTQ
jgi:4-hydroxy-tetrahydrodipicolinate synthase